MPEASGWSCLTLSLCSLPSPPQQVMRAPERVTAPVGRVLGRAGGARQGKGATHSLGNGVHAQLHPVPVFVERVDLHDGGSHWVGGEVLGGGKQGKLLTENPGRTALRCPGNRDRKRKAEQRRGAALAVHSSQKGKERPSKTPALPTRQGRGDTAKTDQNSGLPFRLLKARPTGLGGRCDVTELCLALWL